MMRKSLFILLILPGLLHAYGPQTPPPARPGEAEDGGLWPTRKMMDLMVARWADMVTDHYDLDEKQSTDLSSKMRERWTRFAHDNEGALKPVLNEFVEMRIQMEVPTKEQVQAWSTKAGRALELFEKEITQGAEEMRVILRDDQRAKFDGEMMGFQAGLGLAKGQIAKWQSGEFNEREFWDPPMAVRRQRRAAEDDKRRVEEASKAAHEAGQKPAPDGPVDQIAAEVDAWTQYVEDFIKKYELDEAQIKSARSILKEMKERALAHRDANKAEIDKIEARIVSHTGTDEELAAIKEQLVKLYGPIDAMFEELQRRLDPIPTAKQKAAAGKKESEKPEENKPAEPEENRKPRL